MLITISIFIGYIFRGHMHQLFLTPILCLYGLNIDNKCNNYRQKMLYYLLQIIILL